VALRQAQPVPARSATRAIPVDLVRIAIAGALSLILAAIATRAFDQLVWPIMAVPVMVTGAGALARRRTLPVRTVVAVVAVLAAAALAGVWSGASSSDVANGFVGGWRRLLSTEWPSPRDPQVVVAVACLIGVITAASVELAGRPRFHLAPLLPVAVGLAGVMSIAAPRRPSALALGALGLAALALTVLPAREDARTRARTLLGERSLPAVVVSLVIAAIAASTAVAWNDRADPRHTEPADSTAAVLDPIEEVIALRESQPTNALYRITDRSTLIGRSLPARWRLAALADYDGQRWVPTITLRPIGTRLGMPSPSRPDVAPPIAFDVELLTDDFDLVPLPGRPLSVDTGQPSGVQTDAERTVVRLAEEVEPGATVKASAEVAPRAIADRTTLVSTRQVDEIALGFADTARSMAGSGTVLDQLARIEQTMHDEWSLDPAAPGGQQLALIDRFLTEERRGTEEQFVTGFVLLARSLGVDARIATGFVVPPDELQAPLELRSSHAAAWPEVELEGIGWLAFDPTPEQPSDEQGELPPPPAAQSPAAAQPPIRPPAVRPTDDDDQAPEASSGPQRWGSLRTWLVRAGVGGGLAVLPFLLVIGSILTVKSIRRRRRVRRRDPARRIVGAWANATDSLIDAGLTIAPAWTDLRIAESAAGAAVSGAPDHVQRLATNATAMTFGEPAATGELADESVTMWRTIDDAIRHRMSRWQRLRWRLSLRSLRRSTRTPVVA
jgi:transglutaminase-like putative cysteine protease